MRFFSSWRKNTLCSLLPAGLSLAVVGRGGELEGVLSLCVSREETWSWEKQVTSQVLSHRWFRGELRRPTTTQDSNLYRAANSLQTSRKLTGDLVYVTKSIRGNT